MFKKYNLEFYRHEYKFFVWIIILSKSVHSTIEHNHFYLENHQNEKQISLESCLGRFDVHGNTIIRTGESQAIGGKFLQGLELETPEKCQRLCCETSDCDVYVFEEKNDGYCYLFQCGSPKNFHCKFTRHANYTSALLTQFKASLTTTPTPNINIPLANISTQEQELISLKSKAEKNFISSTTQTIIQGGNENGLIPAEIIEPQNLSCGRFEFPCHSGECIAVYNACNGIPQCVDGSDEGPECSDATNNKANNNFNDNAKSGNIQESSTYRHNFKKPVDLKEINDVHFVVPTDLGISSFVRNNNNEPQHVLTLERSNEKMVEKQKEMFAQQQPEIKSSFPTPQIAAHIFNENSKWPTEQRPQYNIVTHEPLYSTLNQPPNNNPGNNHKHFVPENEEILSAGSRLFNQDSQVNTRLQNNADYVGKNSQYADYSEKSTDSAKKDMAVQENEILRPTTSVKKPTHPDFIEQYKKMEQHLEIKFTDHDGHSEKPRGAVLSLTLGLLVTTVIIILIGCRLRTIGRRRSHHGGKVPYAPDEDFLVNGMYL